MKLDSFRIRNFRSIADTAWCRFSPDGVTAFVGENESGKTSVLEALQRALSDTEITEDDIRINAKTFPRVEIRLTTSEAELKESLARYPEAQVEALVAYLSSKNWAIDLCVDWEKDTSADGTGYSGYCSIKNAEMDDVLEAARILITTPDPTAEPDDNAQAATGDAQQLPDADEEEAAEGEEVAEGEDSGEGKDVGDQETEGEEEEEEEEEEEKEEEKEKESDSEEPTILTSDELADLVYDLAPRMTFFSQELGLLPSSIDIDDNGELVGDGAAAANNFLLVAGLDLPELVRDEVRTRSEKLRRANNMISEDFARFWSQTIGKSGKLELACEYTNYDDKTPEKAGKPHLIFWISDGLNRLYFKQRSLGVRWFMSFYLQLKGTEREHRRRVFLLDEPGANLHSKAQADVLLLINKLSEDVTVVYSTHSPSMIEYDKLYRVHAVQREGDTDDSPTGIIDAHVLGAASTDTLSPVLTAMGTDLSHQLVIRKENNVLLEEMSGYYYLTAFWLLTQEKQEAHFIAATGVNKVEALANMFRGWGLDFIVAIDDDSSGRRVYKQLKRTLFGDDDEEATANLLKFKNCIGIEDAFSQKDFKAFVLDDATKRIEGANSDFLKRAGLSKPVLAYTFLIKVRKGEISRDDLEPATREGIGKIVTGITTRLAGKKKLA